MEDTVQAVPLDEALQQLTQTRGVTPFTKGVSYVCSVFPVAKRVVHNHFWMPRLQDSRAPRTSHKRPYVLRAVTKPGKFDVLTVYDTGQQAIDPSFVDGHAYILRPITAKAVAESLVETWTRGGGLVDSAGAPGIGIIAEEAPTEAELFGLNNKQTQLAADMLAQADEAWAADKKTTITRLHRLLARYLGATSTTDHPWLLDYADATDTKRCVACSATIENSAKKCRFCGADLILWALEHFYTPEQLKSEDPHLAKHLKEFIKRREAASKS